MIITKLISQTSSKSPDEDDWTIMLEYPEAGQTMFVSKNASSKTYSIHLHYKNGKQKGEIFFPQTFIDKLTHILLLERERHISHIDNEPKMVK